MGSLGELGFSFRNKFKHTAMRRHRQHTVVFIPFAAWYSIPCQNHLKFRTLESSALDTQDALRATNQRDKQLWLDAWHSSFPRAFCASLPLSREEQGGSVCDGKRCVGVGSILVLGNALSILCSCNAVVSYSGDDEGLCPFPSKTKTVLFMLI